MKEPFSRFALRFPLTLGLGAVMLLLHDSLASGLFGALLPRNASAWELSKLAFFPPLLCLALTSRQSGGPGATLRRAAAPVVLGALMMAGFGTLAVSLTAETAAIMLLWIVLAALTLAGEPGLDGASPGSGGGVPALFLPPADAPPLPGARGRGGYGPHRLVRGSEKSYLPLSTEGIHKGV